MLEILYNIYYKFPVIRFLKKKLGLATPIIKVNINWDEYYHIGFCFFASMPVALKAKKRGIENTILRQALKLLKYQKGELHNSVIIDVGANWGFLTLVFAKTIAYPDGKVFSFEPHPKIYKWLLRSVKENNLENNTVVKNNVVGETNKKVYINLFEGTSNMLEKSGNKIEIQQILLDDFLKDVTKIDVIKIDVDGYEYNVLSGACNTIDQFRPICIVETNHDKKILDFFIERKYYLYDLNLKEVESEIPGNLVCLPQTINQYQ